MKRLVLLCSLVVIVGCGKTEETYSVDTVKESAQQVGDVVASIDESGGNTSGGFTLRNEMESARKAYARISNGDTDKTLASMLVPDAQAAACSTVGFGTCTSGQLVRDFAGCTTGLGGVITGNVTLTFNGTGCTIPNATHYVDRVPNFQITGLRGATFSVEATGSGQRLTRNGGSTFTFTNSGIKRKFVTPNSVTLLDLTTTTQGTVTITGNSRATRTMTAAPGDGIVLTNNLTSEVCTLTPSGVTWGAGCNCPTAGSFSGTCTGTSDTFTVTFGSTCGAVTVSKTGDATNESVILDRCTQ